MKHRLYLALIALLVLTAGQSYNGYPPVYAPNVYVGNVESGSLVGANSTTGQLTPISLGTGCSIVSSALSCQSVSVYNTSGSVVATSLKVVFGASFSCTTGSAGNCTATTSFSPNLPFTSTSTFNLGGCTTSIGSNGATASIETQSLSSVTLWVRGGASTAYTLVCNLEGY